MVVQIGNDLFVTRREFDWLKTEFPGEGLLPVIAGQRVFVSDFAQPIYRPTRLQVLARGLFSMFKEET